jgi:hypothetical protein
VHGVVVLATLALMILGAYGTAPARADYEQAPGHFGVSGEAAQLSRSNGMAINAAGIGGVEAGSVYVVGSNGRVLRFTAGSEGKEPEFREAWGWGVGDGAQEFQRCGPAYVAEPRPAHAFSTCQPDGTINAGEQVGHFGVLSGVAVDQATGDVYVLDSPNNGGIREHHLIEVFTANGAPIGEGFGDYARVEPFSSESIAEGPEKLHEQSPVEEADIAVNEAGVVFVTDRDITNAPGTHAARIMSFEPEHAGDYEHYVYAGQGKDITTPFLSYFIRIATVGSNRLVAASKQQIREYPTLGGSSAICSYEVSAGEIDGMATNSVTGEVFYFRAGIHGKVAHLGPCNPATGKFEELQQQPFSPTPEAEHVYALAVNPDLAWNPQRPQGVLYGADPQVGTSAENKGIGDVFVPAVAQSPTIESESVANTTSTSSTLQARIDPRGVAVIFHFQYLTESEYLGNGRSFAGPNTPRTAPLMPGELGSGSVGTATAAISNLAPDGGYVFRVIAERHGCSGEPSCQTQGSTATFRTFPVTEPGLPDGRAYELVSPAQKQGGEVFPADDQISSCLGECKPPGGFIFSVFPMQSAPDGDAVSFMGYPFSPNEGAAVFNSYISRRTTTGWQTTAMSPRLQGNRANVGYAESLEQGVITTEGSTPLAEDAPADHWNLYLQSAQTSMGLRPLLTNGLFGALAENGRPYRGTALILKYAGYSPDFSAQYFEANDSLTFADVYAPEPPDPGSAGRNLYEWREGSLNLVNVLPGNTAVATGAAFASASPDANGIAEEGHRVFWAAGAHLYVREDNRTTREIHDPGAFLTASADGLEVLLSDGCLYSLTTASCSADLTQGQGGFLGVAGQSKDLSRIYFVDTSVLPGENERKEEAQSGHPNLYLYEAGTGTRFIATLAPHDGSGEIETLDDWAARPGERTAEASPDGRYLAFGSVASLTDNNNVGPCEVRGTDENALDLHFVDVPCHEVFLYDSVTGRLACPSCSPSGEAPLGNSTLRRIYEAKGWFPQPRYLTDQGRLVFDSSDRLSPRDTNGRVEDVYEAEPEGVGSCARVTGCVSLISSGAGSVDSNFLAMDENGSNVFFTTRGRLVPEDTDELLDVYDVRVGGGFPGEGEAADTGCHGESCQSPPNPPQASSSVTSSYQGAGNVEEEESQSCLQGQVVQNGVCVKPKAKVQKKKAKTQRKKAKGRKKKAKKTTVRSVKHRIGGSK